MAKQPEKQPDHGQPAAGHPPTAGQPPTGTLPGAAGPQSADVADRNDANKASGSEPPVQSGRHSGQSAEDAGTAAPAGPLSGNAGAPPPGRPGQSPRQRTALDVSAERRIGGYDPPQPDSSRAVGRIGTTPTGEDVTLSQVAALIRQFNAAAAARNFWEAFRIAGELIQAGANAGLSQFQGGQMPIGRAAAQHPDHQAAAGEFDRAVAEFHKARADAVSFAPQMHTAGWHQSGGPAAGSAAPLAPRMAGIHLDPSDLMTLLEIVQRTIDLIHKFRGG